MNSSLSHASTEPVYLLRRMATAAVFLLTLASPVLSQQDNPVYVDDSPQARELLRQARDQTRSNAGEAVRLYQELLKDFPHKLVPASEVATDLFTSTRHRVIDALLGDNSLLDRYRLVQTPAAEQLLQAGDLEIVERSYPLTEPGLESMLRLAQHDLEAGHFLRALSRLRQARSHPDFLGRRAAHGLYMSALAWHCLGHDDRAQPLRDALLALGSDGEAFDRQLEALYLPGLPTIAKSYTILDQGPSPALSDVVAQPIWSAPLEDSLYRRRLRAQNESEVASQGPGRNSGGRVRDSDLATTAATVVGPIAYLNQGHTILAIDRLTGRELWNYQDLSRMGMTESGGGLDALDMNITAVEGDAIVTLTGHAQPSRRSDTGRVICLEKSDGSLRWTSRLSGVIESAPDEELFAHGAPIIVDDVVVVMARKVSAQLLTSAYVVAFDLSNGHVRWARFIASSGGLRIAARPFDSLVERHGSLYMSSAVGATARVDATTGEIQWLRRFSVPINTPIADQTRRPWEMSAPVITSRGLVAVQPDTRRVSLLDLETGDELASHSASTSADWNSPRYLLSDGDRVISVGSDIRGFSVDALDAPLWRVPAPALQQSPDDPVFSESLELRGRVHLAGDRLVAPAAQGVLIIDAFTGHIEQMLPIDAAGNPIAYESQLLIAGADHLDAYMSMRRAEELLRQQLAQSPDDPGPALSLLRLGIRAGNVPLALEACDHAIRAAAARADDPAFDAERFAARAELFSLLLDLVRSNTEFTIDQGEAIFARLQQAAVGPEQRVEHLLAYGDWLSRSRADSLARAVETWQMILADDRLANTWIDLEGVERLARDRAIERLGRVIATRGAATYGPQADFAAIRLVQLRDGARLAGEDSPTDTDLFALAREFPFSSAAQDALIELAERRASSGDVSAALALLAAGYLDAPTRVAASRLFGRYVDLALRDGRDQQAREALEVVRLAWGDLELEMVDRRAPQAAPRASDTPIEPVAAVASAPPVRMVRLSQQLALLLDQTPQKPSLGSLTGGSSGLGGPIVPAAGGFASVMPHDRVLVRDGGGNAQMIKMATSSGMRDHAQANAREGVQRFAWQAEVDGSLPQVLKFDDESIVLWMSGDIGEAQRSRAVSLNAIDGTLQWTMPSLNEILPGWGVRAGQANVRTTREQLPNGESFDSSESLAHVSDQSLVVVHRGGDVAAVSLTDGRTVQWHVRSALEQVHWSQVRYGIIVLAGLARDTQSPDNPRRDRDAADAQQAPAGLVPGIVALDASTGRPIFGSDGLIRSGFRSGIKWMRVSVLGVVMYASADGIEAASLARGNRIWATKAYGTLDSQRAWQTPLRVVFEDQRSRLRSIPFADGLVSEPFEHPLRGEWDPMELRDITVSDLTLLARYGQRIVMFDAESGRVIGADSVAEDRDYRWLIETKNHLVAVSFSSSQRPVNPAGGISRTQYQYTAYVLSPNGKVMMPPIGTEPLPDRVQSVAVIDGWLLLSTLTDTLAIPMNGP